MCVDFCYLEMSGSSHMTYLDTTCLWHPNYDRLAGLVYYMSSVCVCVWSCNLTARKKRTMAGRNRTKGWKWKIGDKRRRGDSAWHHSVRSHLLSKMNECTTHTQVYTHTLTQMNTPPAACIYRNSSTVWLNLEKKSTVCDEAATVMLGATAECDLSLSPQFWNACWNVPYHTKFQVYTFIVGV